MNVLHGIVDFYAVQLRLLWNWRAGRRALLQRAVVTLAVAVVALGVTAWVLPGITIRDVTSAILAAIVLGVLNALIRPLLIGLLSAFSVALVGVGSVVFQVVAFATLARDVPGVRIESFLDVFWGSWLFAVANTLLTSVLSISEDDSYFGTLVRQLAARGRDVIRTDQPGIVIVQIDGLAHPVLLNEIRAGRVPTLSRWVRGRKMVIDGWETLLPSGTSASQAGILYGNNDGVPAFRWWEKDGQRLIVSNHPRDALEIARRVSNGRGLLAADGASIGNLVSGDAVRSYLTLSAIEDGTQGLGQSRAYYWFFASPYSYLHSIVLSIGEVLKELVQARRQRLDGIEPRLDRGFPYPLARAATNVLLRHLSTSLVMEEMFRGTPLIYVDFTDYDEIAHHSGPERADALAALEGLDRVIGTLEKAAADTPRPYRFIVLSDHGQSLGATFRQRYGKTLQKVTDDLMDGRVSVSAATGRVEEWGALNALFSETAKSGGAAGALSRAAFKRRTVNGIVELDEHSPRPRHAADASGATAPPECVVCASGNLALISFPRLPGRASLEALDAAYPRVVEGLARHEGVGIVMVRSDAHRAIAIGARGVNYLDEGRVEGTDPVPPYGPHAAAALRRLDAMPNCGDLVVISMLDPALGEVAAFEELVGSHGGLGGWQTQAFLLHPAEWPVEEKLVGAPAIHRQIRRWLERGGAGSASPATP